MATATKTLRAFQASATNTAGSTTTGSSVDLTTALGCTVTLEIINGATGPTVPCSAIVDVSNDNSDWMILFVAYAGTANAQTYTFQVQIPADVMYARSRFTGNTAQSVTVEADGHELTSIA